MQTSSPSHVKFIDDLQQPLRALEQECVEKEDPPCMSISHYELYSFFPKLRLDRLDS